MLSWIVLVTVYAAAAIAGAAIAFVRPSVAALSLLLGVLVVTPFGYMAMPPVAVLSHMEVFILTGSAALLTQCGMQRRSLRVPWALVTFAGYYAIRLLADLAVEDATWFSYLRDLRPIVSLFAIIALGEALRTDSIGLRPHTIIAIAALAIGLDLVTYLVGTRIGVGPAGITGEFLARTGVLRYSDELTVTLYGFLSYAFVLEKRRSARIAILSLLAVLAVISLNRVFMLFAVLNAVWLTYDEVRGRTGSRAIASAVVAMLVACLGAVVAAVVASWIGTDSEALARLLDLTSMSRLLTALAARFVAPAMDGGYELNVVTVLFGAGPSFLFYIPWFEYRGLESYHASVDSFFFAAFVKYGVTGMVLLTIVVARCLWRLPNRLGHAWFWAYLVVHNAIAVPAILLFLFLSLATKSRYLAVVKLNRARVRILGASVIGRTLLNRPSHAVRA